MIVSALLTPVLGRRLKSGIEKLSESGFAGLKDCRDAI
jgi:hypothetical protein